MADKYTNLTCPLFAETVDLSPESPAYKQIEDMKALATKLLTDQEGWTNHSTTNEGMIIDLKHIPDMTLPYVRGKITVDGGVEIVHRIMENYANKSAWDVRHHETCLADVITNTVLVQHAEFTTPWPLSWRDFIALCYVQRLNGQEGTIHKIFQSTDIVPTLKEVANPYKKYVRGDIIMATYTLVPNVDDVNKTDITYIVAIDPKGSIPSMIVSSTTPDLVGGLNTIPKILEDETLLAKIVTGQDEWYAKIMEIASKKA